MITRTEAGELSERYKEIGNNEAAQLLDNPKL